MLKRPVLRSPVMRALPCPLPSLQAVLAAPVGELRGAGLSERKAAYLRDLAAHFADGRLSDARILGMEEEELEAALCRVHGIGVWTAQMHSMFHRGEGEEGRCRGLPRMTPTARPLQTAASCSSSAGVQAPAHLPQPTGCRAPVPQAAPTSCQWVTWAFGAACSACTA